MDKLLQINNLIVGFEHPDGELKAVKGVSLELNAGETLALVGESGCGKTVLCKSMLRILCEKGRIRQGEILLEDRELTALTEQDMTALRGGEIAMVFQDPYTALDPAFSVGSQIAEVLRLHQGLSAKAARNRAIELMELVQIPRAEQRYQQRPYQFSGGMRQRIVIAIALAGNPKLLLADEPTTALDEETQTGVLRLLKEIQQKTGVAILFITHDLNLVEDLASRVAVMQDGRIVEQGTVEEVFQTPRHAYTKKLLGYLDYKKNRGHHHRGHGGAAELDAAQQPVSESGRSDGDSHRQPVLTVSNVSKAYPVQRNFWEEHREASGTAAGHGGLRQQVLRDFSMTIEEGEIVGLIGPSGCGKSTLSRCITGLETPDSGEITIRSGIHLQMIFQDSQSAFNERMTVEKIIGEPLRIAKKGGRAAENRTGLDVAARRFRKKDLQETVLQVMEAVELDPALRMRKPYELSGGQRQRVAIARALITDPEFIIADEPLTGLDVSAQAQIVHLLKKLAEDRNLTILFIAHDLPMVNHVSDRVIRMQCVQREG